MTGKWSPLIFRKQSNGFADAPAIWPVSLAEIFAQLDHLRLEAQLVDILDFDPRVGVQLDNLRPVILVEHDIRSRIT